LVRPETVNPGDSEPVEVQVPPFTEYSYAVIADPPFEAGVKVTPRVPFPPVTPEMVGAAGTVTGIPSATADPAPSPAAFTARISIG
jgi:hypothetical protein